jgi:hypothetical protein
VLANPLRGIRRERDDRLPDNYDRRPGETDVIIRIGDRSMSFMTPVEAMAWATDWVMNNKLGPVTRRGKPWRLEDIQNGDLLEAISGMTEETDTAGGSKRIRVSKIADSYHDWETFQWRGREEYGDMNWGESRAM